MSAGVGEVILSILVLTLCIHSQAMAEQLAENYHNTWGRKKKQELETKGESTRPTPAQTPSFFAAPSYRFRNHKGPTLELWGFHLQQLFLHSRTSVSAFVQWG